MKSIFKYLFLSIAIIALLSGPSMCEFTRLMK